MSKIFALISRIRKISNQLLIDELDKCGIHGVVPSHGDILYVLSQVETCSMKDLADKIHRTRPTVTVLINKLMKLGLVEKEINSDDARVSLVRLTPKCIELMPQIKSISKKLLNTGLDGFSNDEEQILTAYLERVYNNFNK